MALGAAGRLCFVGSGRADGSSISIRISTTHGMSLPGYISLFDNGNTRVSLDGGNSRGQVWKLDETNMTATPVVDVDLGSYSAATGSAQRLGDGGYHFYLGFINGSKSDIG